MAESVVVVTDDSQVAGVLPQAYWAWRNDRAELVNGGVIEEVFLSIYVNGQDLATLMCSPVDREALAVGFLYNEHVIQSIDEVGLVQMNATRTAVDVLLKHEEVALPRRMILTSGCGGGISFQDLAQTYPGLESNFVTNTETLFARMHDLQSEAQLYQQVRGVHTSILADTDRLLISAEDVGRHNTIDKIAGKALQSGIDMTDRILLTSGRISSEMLGKARQMGVPIVVSRTSPTSITLTLARAWKICVVGYLRQGSMRVYTHPERLGLLPLPDEPASVEG